MTVVISGHFIRAGRVGGAEHVLYNLLRGLSANGTACVLLCSDASALDTRFRDELSRLRLALRCDGLRGKRFLVEQMACLDASLRSDAILFPNYFTPPVVPARLGRVVTLVHDFHYRAFPATVPRARRAWLALAHRLTFARADTVVLPSEFVLGSVPLRHARVIRGKAAVIPNPVSWARFEGDSAAAPFDGRPYVLSVAAHYPHKNLEVLIRAFARLVRRFPEILLVLTGQLPGALLGIRDRRDHATGLIDALGLNGRVVVTGYVDDRTLGHLYRNALLFAFPSLFEGFGLPAVEAMGWGIPTITTRHAALPEVTLGKAIYVEDAHSAGEWADTLAAVIDAPARHAVDAAVVDTVRRRYAPERIAALYADLLLGRRAAADIRSDAASFAPSIVHSERMK
jgi:glycosyltransferase involved in cell wall biosynthesis